jgi:SnoaL-like domain
VDLQQISDRLEIQDVLIRYTRAVDTNGWDGLDTVFTPDATIDYTETGGIAGSFPEVKAWLAETLPAFFSAYMHTLGQVAIDYDESGANPPQSAEVAAYFDNPMLMRAGDGEPTVVEVGGIYHHSMVRTPDGWRSRRLHEQLVWRRGI